MKRFRAETAVLQRFPRIRGFRAAARGAAVPGARRPFKPSPWHRGGSGYFGRQRLLGRRHRLTSRCTTIQAEAERWRGSASVHHEPTIGCACVTLEQAQTFSTGEMVTSMRVQMFCGAALLSLALGAPSAQALTKGEFESICEQRGGMVVEQLDGNGNVIDTYCRVPGGTDTVCEHRTTNVGPNVPCWYVGIADRAGSRLGGNPPPSVPSLASALRWVGKLWSP